MFIRISWNGKVRDKLFIINCPGCKGFIGRNDLKSYFFFHYLNYGKFAQLIRFQNKHKTILALESLQQLYLDAFCIY